MSAVLIRSDPGGAHLRPLRPRGPWVATGSVLMPRSGRLLVVLTLLLLVVACARDPATLPQALDITDVIATTQTSV